MNLIRELIILLHAKDCSKLTNMTRSSHEQGIEKFTKIIIGYQDRRKFYCKADIGILMFKIFL